MIEYAHIIKDGRVTNTIVWKKDLLPTGMIDASLGGSKGDLWDGVKFSKPPPAELERTTSEKIDKIIDVLLNKNVISAAEVKTVKGDHKK